MLITAMCAECGKINNSPRSDLCSNACRMRRVRRVNRERAERARSDVRTLLDLAAGDRNQTLLLRSIDRALVELTATK